MSADLHIDADGWCTAARRIESPNSDPRPEGEAVSLVVMHCISLPPGEFGGPYIEELFLNRLDPAAHPYFVDVAPLRGDAIVYDIITHPHDTALRSPSEPSSLTRNLGTMNSEMPLTLSGASGVLARTRWMMFSVRSCSPDEMKILVPVMA